MIIPVVLNLNGNLEMNLSARLSTAANIGLVARPPAPFHFQLFQPVTRGRPAATTAPASYWDGSWSSLQSSTYIHTYSPQHCFGPLACWKKKCLQRSAASLRNMRSITHSATHAQLHMQEVFDGMEKTGNDSFAAMGRATSSF